MLSDFLEFPWAETDNLEFTRWSNFSYRGVLAIWLSPGDDKGEGWCLLRYKVVIKEV